MAQTVANGIFLFIFEAVLIILGAWLALVMIRYFLNFVVEVISVIVEAARSVARLCKRVAVMVMYLIWYRGPEFSWRRFLRYSSRRMFSDKLS